MFWLVVGAGTGVWATRKATRVARRLTPQSLAGRAAVGALGAGDRMRAFARDVRDETLAREAELREAIEMDRHPPEPEGSRPRRILRAPYTVIDEDKDGH
ncbi:hypothetical protein DFJ69_0009 [Thermomonospora umbrina]|uniref:Secreted protein n=2 Tax=Thermomonospora umbrina TaxID=111806 RepID=A0A3D9SSH5_9ACTN|nr:hypothetical protein DFJ69_0009 [Thermomonospora umbrina]